MHLKTTDMLQELDFVDDKNLKMLYNYNCATNRVNYDFKLVAQEDHKDRSHDPKIIELQHQIAKETSLASVKKKCANNKIARVFEKTSPLPKASGKGHWQWLIKIQIIQLF